MVGIELERPAKRLQRLRVPLVVEQRASQEQQGIEIVWILLEHFGEPGNGGADATRAPQ